MIYGRRRKIFHPIQKNCTATIIATQVTFYKNEWNVPTLQQSLYDHDAMHVPSLNFQDSNKKCSTFENL